MTDGHVSLHGESRYRQHRGVGRRLGAEAAQNAERLTEGVRIPPPDLLNLLRQPQYQQQQVADG